MIIDREKTLQEISESPNHNSRRTQFSYHFPTEGGGQTVTNRLPTVYRLIFINGIFRWETGTPKSPLNYSDRIINGLPTEILASEYQ